MPPPMAPAAVPRALPPVTALPTAAPPTAPIAVPLSAFDIDPQAPRAPEAISTAAILRGVFIRISFLGYRSVLRPRLALGARLALRAHHFRVGLGLGMRGLGVLHANVLLVAG